MRSLTQLLLSTAVATLMLAGCGGEKTSGYLSAVTGDSCDPDPITLRSRLVGDTAHQGVACDPDEDGRCVCDDRMCCEIEDPDDPDKPHYECDGGAPDATGRVE